MREEGEEGEEGEVCERRKTSWSEILERDEKQVWRRIARRGRQGIDARMRAARRHHHPEKTRRRRVQGGLIKSREQWGKKETVTWGMGEYLRGKQRVVGLRIERSNI